MIGPLTAGTRIVYLARGWVVVTADRESVLLEDPAGERLAVLKQEIIGSTGFRLLTGKKMDSANAAVLLSSVPESEQQRVRLLEPHFNEIASGYKSGDSAIALPEEPLAAFDPDLTTVRFRLQAKADELARLGYEYHSLSWVRSRYYRWQQLGLYGLVQEDKVRPISLLDDVDPAIIEIIHSVIAPLTAESLKGKKTVLKLIAAAIEEAMAGGTEFVMPSRAKLQKLVSHYSKNAGFGWNQSNVRSKAAGPVPPFHRYRATHPGEVVLIDATPVDLELAGASGEKIRAELIFALDLYDRAIVGWFLAPGHAKAVDAVYLLYRILTPKRADSTWPRIARWRYPSVPESIVLNLARDDQLDDVNVIAGIPILRPEKVVVDHGKIFVSTTFRRALARIGCDLDLARFKTPTDKPQVERVFLTAVSGLFEALPGHKGANTTERGTSWRHEDLLTIPQLDDEIGKWVATVYHNTPHSALVPDFLARMQEEWTQLRQFARKAYGPQAQDYQEAAIYTDRLMQSLQMSPNEMYAEGLARTGFNVLQVDRGFVIDLLPVHWGAIDDEGVTIDNLQYDSDDEWIQTYRNMPSAHRSRKHPFRKDTNDPGRIWFQDRELEWHELQLISSQAALEPFQMVKLQTQRALLADPESRRRIRAEAERADSAIFSDLLATVQGRRKIARYADRASERDRYARLLLPEGTGLIDYEDASNEEFQDEDIIRELPVDSVAETVTVEPL